MVDFLYMGNIIVQNTKTGNRTNLIHFQVSSVCQFLEQCAKFNKPEPFIPQTLRVNQKGNVTSNCVNDHPLVPERVLQINNLY